MFKFKKMPCLSADRNTTIPLSKRGVGLPAETPVQAGVCQIINTIHFFEFCRLYGQTRFISTILCILISLSSCNTDQQCICPEYFAPVCGNNGKTYPNPCSAECDEVSYYDGECPEIGLGQVVYTGDSICGYLLRIFQEDFKPTFLQEELKENGKVISMRYRKLNKYFTCEQPYGHFREIDIIEIFNSN